MENRKGKRSGAEPVEPMYTIQDAEAACRLFLGVEYDKRIQLAPGIEARFVDVGHLLGSASIELWITEGSTTTKLVFSGDIGNLDQPIIKDPAYIQQADYVFMESTYGDRNHAPRPDYVAELAKILQRTFDRGGNVVVPSFAVGRTQEMLYFLREIKEKGWSRGTATSRSTSTVRWPLKPPASSGIQTPIALTPRPAPCWKKASTPSMCRGCASA